MDSGYAKDVYIEAGDWSVMVFPPGPDGMFPENWEELADYDSSKQYYVGNNFDNFVGILAPNDIETFTVQHSRTFADEIPGNSRTYVDGTPVGFFQIEYAEGFDETSFVYTEGEPLPVILFDKHAIWTTLVPRHFILSPTPLNFR